MLSFKNIIEKNRNILRILLIANAIFIAMMCIFPQLGDYLMPSTNIYDSFAQTKNKAIFREVLRANTGKMFAYGELEAINAVSLPELNGQYMYIKRVKEEKKTSMGLIAGAIWTHHDEWEEVDSTTQKCKQVKFLGAIMDRDKIQMPDAVCIKTIKKSSEVRYKYYAIRARIVGTMYIDFENNTHSDNFKFYNESIRETIISLKKHDRAVIMLCVLFATSILWMKEALR